MFHETPFDEFLSPDPFSSHPLVCQFQASHSADDQVEEEQEFLSSSDLSPTQACCYIIFRSRNISHWDGTSQLIYYSRHSFIVSTRAIISSHYSVACPPRLRSALFLEKHLSLRVAESGNLGIEPSAQPLASSRIATVHKPNIASPRSITLAAANLRTGQ